MMDPMSKSSMRKTMMGSVLPRGALRQWAAFVVYIVLAHAPVAAYAQGGWQDRAAVSRAKGYEQAPILVYEIADFQCPYCARFSNDVFPKLDRAYVQTGKVQWVFVNLPLPPHPKAWAAAEAALCAGAVADSFWPFHNRLFAHQREWSDAEDPMPIFLRYAEEAEIPIDEFRDCMVADHVAQLLLKDVVFAATARVNGTPTFIIDGEKSIVGLKSFEEWKEILEEALKKRGGAPRP